MTKMTQGTVPAQQTAADHTEATGTGTGPLRTEHGKTTIADVVVTKMASIAAREVPGVYDLGGAASRTFGAVAQRIPGSRGTATSPGVAVEVGEHQAAVDLTLVADYGVPITDATDGVRRNVIDTIERMAGLEVTEVNIDVIDVYIPGQDDAGGDSSPSRVE
jgi:uncharacterized alkaline shock family protein YloU